MANSDQHRKDIIQQESLGTEGTEEQQYQLKKCTSCVNDFSTSRAN